MKKSAHLYSKLCETMDKEVKTGVVLPSEMYDAAIVFLASVAARARNPESDLKQFIQITSSRLAAAMQETEGLIAARNN